MHLVQSLDKMSDIHSTITTTSGYLFYQLVSFAFELRLRKSVQISLIVVSGSAHNLTQGQMEAVPCEKAFVGLG